jgi:predicted dehydrogenase
MTMFTGAIIGVGKIAQTGHLPAFDDPRLNDRARVVAGVDTDPTSRALALERFPALRLYSDIEEMLAKEEIDFVDICATPNSHYRLIEIAAARGKHILCEKPLAVSLEESAKVASIVCRRDPAIVFMPCHQYRYSELWRQMKAFTAAHAVEEGMLLQFNVFRTGADPGLLPRDRIWRVDQNISGGGILADTGIHYLYLSLWMLGFPRAVTARTHRLALQEGKVEDTATVLLEYDHRLVQITLTWSADRRTNSACVVTPAGSLFYDGKFLLRTKGTMNEVIPVPDASDKSHYVQLYVSLLIDFVEMMQTGKSGGPNMDEAEKSMRLLDACYASARSGIRVTLEPTP